VITKRKTSKPAACGSCASRHLARRITTYPVKRVGPLEGKEIHVGRVALYECQACGHLMPTPAGHAKVERNVNMGSGCSWVNYLDYHLGYEFHARSR
jgi:hypothetical protein